MWKKRVWLEHIQNSHRYLVLPDLIKRFYFYLINIIKLNNDIFSTYILQKGWPSWFIYKILHWMGIVKFTWYTSFNTNTYFSVSKTFTKISNVHDLGTFWNLTFPGFILWNNDDKAVSPIYKIAKFVIIACHAKHANICKITVEVGVTLGLVPWRRLSADANWRDLLNCAPTR